MQSLNRTLRTLLPESSLGRRRQAERQQQRLGYACLLCLLLIGSATAQQSASISHWGEYPARVEADSLLLRPEPQSRSAWEWPLYVPYRIIRWPFSLLMTGAKGIVVFGEESGTIDFLARIFGSVQVPYGFRLSLVADQLIGGGVGLDFYHDDFLQENAHFQLKSQWTTAGRNRISIGLIGDPSKTWIREAGAGYRINPRARYFGPESDLESFYLEETSWVGMELTRRLSMTMAFQGSVSYSFLSTRPPREGDGVPIDDPARYQNNLPTGFGEETQGGEFRISWVRDTTKERGRPKDGGIQRIVLAHFEPVSDDAPFSTLRAELQQFWPLWHDRTLAFRLAGAHVDAGHSEAHFARLYTNDDPDQMRGFNDFRFRARSMLLWNLEYRYPIWAYRSAEGTGLDFCLFQDGGQFFDKSQQLGLSSIELSHGVGIRFIGSRGFGARFEVGFSHEDVVFRLSTDQVFQYAHAGLYHGHPPYPQR